MHFRDRAGVLRPISTKLVAAGPGLVSTEADAARATFETGMGGRFHTQKAQDTARGLRNWLGKNPHADPHDRLVARSLYDELVDVLGRAP